MKLADVKISVVGLGYVGLPVAIAFGHKSEVIGFDINQNRIDELKSGTDRNLEVSKEELSQVKVSYSANPEDLKSCNFHIVTVPTPIDASNNPDLGIVRAASRTLGSVIKKGDVIVFESTVFPGATEDICVPILEKESGLKMGIDFKVGYSPERINPGDKKHTFTQINKVVSGCDEESTNLIAEVYGSVINAEIFQAKSIKVAEAAKVIENTQRDINIAFMNELSIIFDKLGIETNDVLEAARTKWNFLPFYPGLVGGHCIGVDPYYLTYKAESIGYHPQVILSGRRINDSMAKRVADQTIKLLIHNGHQIKNSTVTILGLTFKENTPDIRNTKIIDIIKELEDFGVHVQVHDPLAYSDEAKHEYGLDLVSYNNLKPAQAVVFGVSHREFEELKTDDIKKLMEDDSGVFVNVRSHFSKKDIENAGFKNWFL